MSKKHDRQICRNNLNIFTFVLQFTSYFLVLTRCSRIYEESALTLDEKKANPYCKAIRNCSEGQHVMCLFGSEPGIMGPRCHAGRQVELLENHRNLLLEILNGFRSKVATGKETGEDGAALPRALGVMRLKWSFTLSTLAQVWVNQCVQRKDFCRATENYPNAGQMVGVTYFNYPEFDVDGATFKVKTADMTSEKTDYAIKAIWDQMYLYKKWVTSDMIKYHTGNGEENPYLLAIYANSNRVGCAMSRYVDYYNLGPLTPVIYYVVELVCNFSNMPSEGDFIYNTNPAATLGSTPCGCPNGYSEGLDCLCDLSTNKTQIPPPERPENDTANMDSVPHSKPDKKDNSTNKEDNKNGTDTDNGNNSTNKDGNNDNNHDGGSGGCNSKGCKPSVVLMPIFTMENADSDKLNKINGLETTTMNAIERRKMQIRQRIRDRVKNVRDRYFNNYVVIEPGTRFSDGGPIDEDTFALSKYEPPNLQPNLRSDITKYSLTKKRPKINIKPRRDFSHLEELVSDYLLYKHNKAVNSPGDTEDRSFNDMIHAGTARKSFIPPQDDTRAVTRRTGFDNLQRPSIRKLRYGVQGFNYKKAPYINNLNDDHDQLASDLYNLEQKSEDIAYNGDMNEMHRTNTLKATESIPRVRAYPYSNLLRSTKQIRNDNFMDNIDPIDYASDDNEDAASDIDYDHRTVEAQRELNWPVTRNQNPLHTHTYGTSNFDYYRHYENDKGYRTTEHVKPKSMLMNLADDNVRFDNEEVRADRVRYGYSGGRTRPYGYDKNELRNYYFDLLKHARPFKRPKDTGASHITNKCLAYFPWEIWVELKNYIKQHEDKQRKFGQSSEFHRRRESDEVEEQKLRYFVPDRANLVRGY